MELSDKNVVVMGLGKSGDACARFLKSRGARVTVTDRRSASAFGEVTDKLKQQGIDLVLGEHPNSLFEKADLLVISPGVPHTIPPVKTALARHIPVIGEIELASRFIREPIVAVTGTNGKTTTTTLIGEMLRASGFKVFVGGNIGTPLIEYVMAGEKADRVVIEVSSFQLDTIRSFRPHVAVLLNVTEDHLDRYDGFTAYCESKARIFENQTDGDVAILNKGDSVAAALADRIASKPLLFDIDHPLGCPAGGWIENGAFRFCLEETSGWQHPLPDILLQGVHNRENILAAGLAALAAGGAPDGIRSALRQFKGLSHRLEYVTEISGVRFFDDSKATNVGAVAKALASFTEPVVLIMGGQGKGGDYSPVKEMAAHRVKKIIALGETRELIADEFAAVCPGGVIIAGSMDEAVRMACNFAESGDAVLLSPAGASFDMFNGYAERGDAFCTAVKKLTPKNTDGLLS